jgi:hypothetical protein
MARIGGERGGRQRDYQRRCAARGCAQRTPNTADRSRAADEIVLANLHGGGGSLVTAGARSAGQQSLQKCRVYRRGR